MEHTFARLTTIFERLFGLTARTRRARAEAAIRRLQEAARYGTPTPEQRKAMDDLEWMPRRMGGR